MERYKLLHVSGGVEPELSAETLQGWEQLEEALVEFLKKGDYEREKDGLFYVSMDRHGKLLNVHSFSNVFMEKMFERAGVEIENA